MSLVGILYLQNLHSKSWLMYEMKQPNFIVTFYAQNLMYFVKESVNFVDTVFLSKERL